jgi:hypothetical protein
MKTLIVASAAITLGCLACKKNMTAPPVNPKTVDSISLQVQKVSTPLSNTKFTGENYTWFQMVNGKIYCANYASPSSVLLAYDMNSNTFQPRTADNNICGCGYESKLVTDGANLFYIANYAETWSASTNAWTTVTYPTMAKTVNGESGVVYYKNKIYFLGGRTASTQFKYYDVSAMSWNYAANYLYTDEGYNQMTVSNDTMYVLGGRNYPAKFSYFTESGGWVALPDLPFNQGLSATAWKVTSFKNKYLFSIADNGDIYVYSITEKKWKASGIKTTITDTYLNLFSDDASLYIAAVNTSNQDFSLYKIQVTGLPD